MSALKVMDRILRNEKLQDQGVTRREILSLIGWVLVLAASYGVCMGLFGCMREDGPEFRQVVACAIKVPCLFLLTLFVTFPSLYVFNTLLGSQERLPELSELVVAAMAVLMAVLAAFGPITAFFSFTTPNYPFILLLNVFFFALAGFFGLGSILKTLRSMPINLDSPRPRRRVIYGWMVLFGIVGAQMGWVLRPFVGSPMVPFSWFRPREASFIQGVMKSLAMLFDVGSR
ncbi:MAG: hypothetical protein ACRC8S_18235 [Fimbriiglobus sp.]